MEAIVGRRISRFPVVMPTTGALSRIKAGRSCLPHMRFPPSPTAPIGLAGAKQTVSLTGLRSRTRPEMVVAPDNTLDSMFSERELAKRNVLLVDTLSSYSRPQRVIRRRERYLERGEHKNCLSGSQVTSGTVCKVMNFGFIEPMLISCGVAHCNK